jgi:acyl-CoA dehydrogenase
MPDPNLARGFYETDELALFRETARRFFAEECAPHLARWDQQGHVDRDKWLEAGARGLLCASIPERYGGGGGTFAYEKVVGEEQARILCSAFGLAVHSGIVARYILAYGSEEQKLRWLPRMATGEVVGAIAMTEPGTGSDLQAIACVARADGGHYVLSGQKTFVSNGQQAGLVIVACKTDPEQKAAGVSLLAVEVEGAAGFRRGRKLDKIGLRGQDTSELFFEEMRVPASSLLGPREGLGFAQLMQQLPAERLLVAIAAVATTETVLAQTLAYVKERKAFGQRVFDFQNTRFKLAEAETEAALGRVFVEKCTELLLQERLDATTAAMAKWWTSEKQFEITDLCLQLHGGYGYMDEYPISRAWRDSRVQRIYGGTNEIMKELIGRSL